MQRGFVNSAIVTHEPGHSTMYKNDEAIFSYVSNDTEPSNYGR
jgi:hypothetical protein